MTTANTKQKHKELKKKVNEVEHTRNFVRDWKTKEELINLKKQKLLMKDKLKNTNIGE